MNFTFSIKLFVPCCTYAPYSRVTVFTYLPYIAVNKIIIRSARTSIFTNI